MGSKVSVFPARATSSVQEVFARVDTQLSEWKESSAITRVNQSAGIQSVACPEFVCESVKFALSIAHKTEGAFDPTWACMWEFWDFKEPRIPSTDDVQQRLHLVDWSKVIVIKNTIFLEEKGMMVGLGGIGKGIALDESRDLLLEQGITEFMLNTGGQVTVHGESKVIGIRKPDGLPSEIIGRVTIQNQSISTSGDYEKYFEMDGLRFHHIIDPRTGFPAKGVRSVTVIAEDATYADAFATALFVMGVKDGMALVESLKGIEALFIDDAGSLQQSTGFRLGN